MQLEISGFSKRFGGIVALSNVNLGLEAGEIPGVIGPTGSGKGKLLMLDEPAAGLSPVNVDKLLDTVLALKARYGLTLLIIEHILKVVMDTCTIVTVLDHGEKIAEGPPETIKNDHRVIEAYLGKEMKDAEVRAFLRGWQQAPEPKAHADAEH